MEIHARLTVQGRVQGVGFRWFVYEEATDLGLVGYVRNLANGNVEAVVEGEKSLVDEFVRRVRKGSGFSKVTQVHVDWQDVSERFSRFEIRH